MLRCDDDFREISAVEMALCRGETLYVEIHVEKRCEGRFRILLDPRIGRFVGLLYTFVGICAGIVLDRDVEVVW